MIKTALYSPQIPENTGNVVRTCACTGTGLVLVEPIGFHTSDRALKRAGLDYWLGVDVEIVEELELEGRPFTCFSSKAETLYTEISYQPDHLLVFGSETAGLPDWMWERWPENFARIPMVPGARCLNLANSVSIVLYEALKQQGFR